MKKWLLLFCVALFGLSLTACGGGDAASDGLVQTENGALIVSLSGNPTTGYTWACTDTPLFLRPDGDPEYRPDAADALLEGGGGVFRFRFEPVASGTETLHFAYARPWDPDSTIEEYELTVTVTETAAGFALSWE